VPIEEINSTGGAGYLHHDRLGSIRTLTDTSGNTIGGLTTYAPNGKVTSGALFTAFRFAGEYTDLDNGLVYERARDYDPSTASFLSRDPLASVTRQPYLYAEGSPTNSVDPSGLISSLARATINSIAGAGDALSFGLTRRARGVLGNDYVDYCTTAYQVAAVAGPLVGALIPGEGELELAAEVEAGAGRAVVDAEVSGGQATGAGVEHGAEVTGVRRTIPDLPQSNLTLNEPPLLGSRPTSPTYHLDPLDRGHGLGPHIDVHPVNGRKYRLPAEGPFGSPFAYLPG
jgi:RHS repeat-associated protein